MRIKYTRKRLTPHKSQLTTIARLPVGIGANGSAQERFLHPSKHIRKKWSNEHRTKRVLEVLLVGKGTHQVNRKNQLFYECRIPKIDNSTAFHICCGKFKIEEYPSTIFKDEIVVITVVADTQNLERERTTALCELVLDVAPNVNGGLSQEISGLLHQGIEVDDNNEPAHENARPSAPETQTIGQWVTPTICPRREAVNAITPKSYGGYTAGQKNLR